MADLVKRLRSQADRWVSPTAFDAAIEREAADAIEELTEALRSSQQWLASYPGDGAMPAWKRNYGILSKYGATNG